MDKLKIVILALAIGLIFVLNYFLLDNYFKENQRHLEETFLSGRDQGIQESVSALFKNTENCNIVPIISENSSKNLIDLDCVRSDSIEP